MNPNVTRHGRSFKGAALYVCHDPLRPGETERFTKERVAFTHTENLPTNDPDKAWRWMAYTAMRQEEIKRNAGGDMRGNKLERPVYAYSLSWHPEENPTRKDMIAAARSSLRALGLHEHEALLVGHNDTEHPHIHLVVNKVHPQTGLCPKFRFDYRRLRAWARGYDKKRGKNYCPRREFNVAAEEHYRKTGKTLEPTPEQREAIAKAKRDRQTKAEYHRWRREQAKLRSDRREADRNNLSKTQKHQRDVLYKAKEERVRSARRAIREEHRPQWRALFQRQRAERRDLQNAQRTASDRLSYWLRNRHLDRWSNSQEDRRGFLKRVYNKLVQAQDMRTALDAVHEAERRDLGSEQRHRVRSTLQEINQTYRQDLAELKERQSYERRDLNREQLQEDRKRARDLKSGRTYEQFMFERDWKEANPPADRPPPNKKPPARDERSAPPKLREDWEEAAKKQTDKRGQLKREFDDATKERKEPKRERDSGRDDRGRERSRERRPRGPGSGPER